MPLQFPQLPSSAPNPDGLSNIMFKVAAEKRQREDMARRFMLDQAKMNHEQQRIDQQDRIQRAKEAMGFHKQMQDTLKEVLPLLHNQPDKAFALAEGHNAAIQSLPPEMRDQLRIDLPAQGPPAQRPAPVQPGQAPTPQTTLMPDLYQPSTGPIPADRFPAQRASAAAPTGTEPPPFVPEGGTPPPPPPPTNMDEWVRQTMPYQPYVAPPQPEEEAGPIALNAVPTKPTNMEQWVRQEMPSPEDRLIQSANLPLEIALDRAERDKLDAANKQAQDKFAQTEAAKQSEYAKQLEAYQNPSFKIGLGGHQVVYHQREIEQGQAEERARTADQMEATIANDQNPWVQRYAPGLIDLFRAGMLDQKELGKSLIALRREDMTAEQKQAALKQANDLAHYRGGVSVQVANIMANRPSLSLGEDRFLQQASKEVRDRTQASIEKALKKNGVEDTNTAISLLDQIGQLLRSNNPDSQKTGLTQLITVKQNGDKRISNQDYNTMVQNAGGYLDSLEGAFNRIGKHGKPPSQIVKMALDTLGLLGSNLRQRQAGIARKVMRQHKDTSFYDPRLAKDILKSEIVGGEDAIEEEAPGEIAPVGIAGPEAAGEARRARVSASGSAVEDIKKVLPQLPTAEHVEGAAASQRAKTTAPKKKPEVKKAVNWFDE